MMDLIIPFVGRYLVIKDKVNILCINKDAQKWLDVYFLWNKVEFLDVKEFMGTPRILVDFMKKYTKEIYFDTYCFVDRYVSKITKRITIENSFIFPTIKNMHYSVDFDSIIAKKLYILQVGDYREDCGIINAPYVDFRSSVTMDPRKISYIDYIKDCRHLKINTANKYLCASHFKLDTSNIIVLEVNCYIMYDVFMKMPKLRTLRAHSIRFMGVNCTVLKIPENVKEIYLDHWVSHVKESGEFYIKYDAEISKYSYTRIL
jgi:hypothetical protein